MHVYTCLADFNVKHQNYVGKNSVHYKEEKPIVSIQDYRYDMCADTNSFLKIEKCVWLPAVLDPVD